MSLCMCATHIEEQELLYVDSHAPENIATESKYGTPFGGFYVKKADIPKDGDQFLAVRSKLTRAAQAAGDLLAVSDMSISLIVAEGLVPPRFGSRSKLRAGSGSMKRSVSGRSLGSDDSGEGKPSPVPPSRRGLRRSASSQSAHSSKSAASGEQDGSKHSGGIKGKPGFRRSVSASSGVSKDSAISQESSTSLPTVVESTTLQVKGAVRHSAAPATQTFEFIEKYGEGGFGEVWACRNKSTGEDVAIKRIPLKEADNVTGSSSRLHRELKVFERLANPYIVKLHEVMVDSDFLYLVMDQCTGGDLAQYMQTYIDEPDRIMRKMEMPDQFAGLPTSAIGRLLWQMLAGIAYMHHHYFCHRDIKLQNYMIKRPSPRPVLQLVDFGMSLRFKKGAMVTGTVGTVKYMAPEVLSGSYNEKCDIWAIGIVCYILCCDKSPWGVERTGGELIKCIAENWREPWPPVDKPKHVRQLIDSMLDRDMEARPSAKHILKTSRWVQKCSHDSGDASCCTVA